jgi:hypothetical protein
MFEKRVLRRIFGPKGDEVTGGWRKLDNEELHGLYSSSILRVIKSRRIRWAGHTARVGRLEMSTKFWLESVKERGHSEGVDVLKWVLGNRV